MIAHKQLPSFNGKGLLSSLSQLLSVSFTSVDVTLWLTSVVLTCAVLVDARLFLSLAAVLPGLLASARFLRSGKRDAQRAMLQYWAVLGGFEVLESLVAVSTSLVLLKFFFLSSLGIYIFLRHVDALGLRGVAEDWQLVDLLSPLTQATQAVTVRPARGEGGVSRSRRGRPRRPSARTWRQMWKLTSSSCTRRRPAPPSTSRSRRCLPRTRRRRPRP